MFNYYQTIVFKNLNAKNNYTDNKQTIICNYYKTVWPILIIVDNI